jgi:uncharacterized beta barrel domain-containing protein DUF5777
MPATNVYFTCLLAIALASSSAIAQDEEIEEVADVEEVTSSGFYTQNHPQVDRAVNLGIARTTRALSFLFIIDHRTNQSIDDSNCADYLGFDAGGLKIGLGLRFGILDDLDVGFLRLNGSAEIFDTYEFDAKYRLLRQEDHFVNVAARAGLSWFVQPDIDDFAGFFGHVLVDRVLFDRLLLGAGLLFHSESSNDVKSLDDSAWSLAVQLAAEVRILSWLAVDLETAINVAGYGSDWPVFALGIKFLTHRHTFSLVFSNNQYISADGMVANTWRGFEDIIVGFQITREFNL